MPVTVAAHGVIGEILAILGFARAASAVERFQCLRLAHPKREDREVFEMVDENVARGTTSTLSRFSLFAKVDMCRKS